MAAHEGSAHAERVEQRGIGEATLEQFRADVMSLSVQYMTGETFGLFVEMRRVRDRILEALDRRQWPRDAAELYLLAGCLSALMAAAATNLGYPQAAEELTRAGWAYAAIIDHRPLMARLRLCAAYAAFWNGRPEQSVNLAASGLEYLADGQNAAQLHLFGGLASARLGDAGSAHASIAAARDARDRDHRDELLEIGGEFGFSRATQSYYAGFILSETAGGQAGSDEAVTELEGAIGLYAAGRARASTTAASAGCSRTPTWPSLSSGPARSTPRSRPWSPSWPCRRANARRSRDSAWPWSGPTWPPRSTGARPPPAGSMSSWPGSLPASSEVCLVSGRQGRSDRKEAADAQPWMLALPKTAVIVACMTANGRRPSSRCKASW